MSRDGRRRLGRYYRCAQCGTHRYAPGPVHLGPEAAQRRTLQQVRALLLKPSPAAQLRPPLRPRAGAQQRTLLAVQRLLGRDQEVSL